MSESLRSLTSLWTEMLSYMRAQHPEICRHWFQQLSLADMSGGVICIRAANMVQRDYLEKRCRDEFNDAAQVVTGSLVAVKFVTDADPVSELTNVRPLPSREPAAPVVTDVMASSNHDSFLPSTEPEPFTQPQGINGQARQHEAIPDQILLNPDYNFPNFVTGPCNRLAHAAALAVAQRPGDAYNPLFIHGGSGLGKTHLLQGICQSVLESHPNANICYLSCDSFKNQFMDSVQKGQMDEFRHRYRHVDILVIDDIHDIQQAERSQEEFFHTFNTLYQSKKQIVISSDSAPDEIPSLEDRLVSRFNWGLVARVDKPCYETRVAIVKKKSGIRGIVIPDEVVCYLASKIESNTRELEGALTGIQARAMLSGGVITLEMAQETLGDASDVAAASPLSIQNIIDAVTSYYEVKLSDLQSKRRHRSITMPRQVCMYLARQHTNLSLEEIGGYFGGRDHTTVMHAVEKVTGWKTDDASFSAQLSQLEDRLQG